MRFSGNDSGSGTAEHDGSRQHTRTKFAAVEQQKLEEKAAQQDGDEDSFESTEVSASKATESRNEVQKVSEKTPSQNHQHKERAKSHKQHEVRSQKRRERRTNSPESLR